MTDELLKRVATDFFRWWWNKPGSNTDDGFDEWAAGPGAELVGSGGRAQGALQSAATDRKKLAESDRVIRQFLSDGVNRNRSERALDLIMGAALRAPEAADAGAVAELISQLRLRAKFAREEGTMTSRCDAEYFDRSANEIERLTASPTDAGIRERAALLEATLRDVPCPRPYNSDPDDLTAGKCSELGHCGCVYGTTLASTERGAATDSPPNDPDMPNLRLCSFNYLADEMRRRGATVTPASHGGDFCNG